MSDLVQKVRLEMAKQTIRNAKAYLRYINKEGEFACPTFWELFLHRNFMPPMPPFPPDIRGLEEAIGIVQTDATKA